MYQVEITHFPMDSPLVKGIVNDGQFRFEAQVMDNGSDIGIFAGRTIMLLVADDEDYLILKYVRGWEVEPENHDEEELLDAIADFLEELQQRYLDDEVAG